MSYTWGMVFQWYIVGDEDRKPLAVNAIARRLSKMGVLTRGDKVAHVAKKQKKGVWTNGMVRHILTCEAYTVTYCVGRLQRIINTMFAIANPRRSLIAIYSHSRVA